MNKYIILLIIILFFPAFISLPIYNDGGAYAYMGSLFFDNKLPYLDGWDHKGISMYFLNALGYLLGFKHLIGIRILELLLIVYSFLSIFKTISKKYTKQTAFMGVFFGLLTLRYFYDGGNMTEEYGAIFVLVSLSIILKKQIKTIDYMNIGLLFLVNFTIRANLISFWVALFLAMIIHSLFKKKVLKKAIFPFSKMVIGIGIYALFLVIYFVMTNSFTEFYNAAFSYNFSYAKIPIMQTLGSIITSTRRYEISLVMFLSLLIAIVSLLKRKIDFIGLLLLFWIPLELYFGNISGKLFAHYYMMWIPIIVLSTAYVLNYFKIEKLPREKQWIVLGIATFLFFQIPFFRTLVNYKNLIFAKENKTKIISSYINSNYNESSLLVWGNRISIYNLTKKRAVVPYFYQTFFKVKSSVTKKIIKDFTKKIINNPPNLIIDAKTPSLLFLDNSNKHIIGSHQKENLQEYMNFVYQNYQLKETIKGVDFYIKK